MMEDREETDSAVFSGESLVSDGQASLISGPFSQPSGGSSDVNMENSASDVDLENVSNFKATSMKFSVDQDIIPCLPMDEQEEELRGLGICAYDQAQFETEIMDQVDQAIQKEESKRFKLRIEREIKSVDSDIQLVKKRLNQLEKIFKFTPTAEELVAVASTKDVLSLKKEYDSKLKHLKELEKKHHSLNMCITENRGDFTGAEASKRVQGDVDEENNYVQQAFAFKESEEERLIRTGQMTPFGTVISESHRERAPTAKLAIPYSGEDNVQQNQKRKVVDKCTLSASAEHSVKPVQTSTSDLGQSSNTYITQRHLKKRRKKIKLGTKHATGTMLKKRKEAFTPNFHSDPEMSDFENGDASDEDWHPDDEDYVPEPLLSEDSDDLCDEVIDRKVSKKSPKDAVSFKKAPKCSTKKSSPRKERIIDDGLQKAYIKRIKLYEKQKLLEKHKKILESDDGIVDSDDEKCVEFDGGFKIPSILWNRLYRYQQTGVRWLWELHQQNCGGIVGDEMGLGKTIQVIAFLAGLKISKLQTDGDSYQGLGPVLLVCPATVMHQWVKEFHSWWPPFCVAILHESGSFVGKKENLIATINCRNSVLVTSYVGLVQHQKCLLSHEWHYIILDEGHKIRNPDAQATLAAKQVRTAHRLILSGSPIQNNLKELWSLFDFVFPGKLGTLPVFMQQFSVPIVQGGYANASQVQVQTAYKCATILRDTIKPYLLRRMKEDVKMSLNLPSKNEQVLFCKLSDDQVQLYKDYLATPEVKSILNARLQVFVGLIHLRKICNHPDLYTGGPKVFKDTDLNSLSDDMHYGYYKRSGKMIVVDALLRLWHKQGHKVLLFTQSRQMMAILEIFVKRREYTYMKMDGCSSVSSRLPAIEKFNSDPSIFVFLLTTRVGGIGVNLTGANRIIIFDPDWNPSTDAQARERSWRIGQEKQVTIYRLLTAGTIEEKIYHRQIFKQFVTNRVLKDPRQRRFFKSNDLYELFTFSEMGNEGTETSAIFAGTGSEVKPVPESKLKKKVSASAPSVKDIKASFSAEKIAKMKELAKKLSLQLLSNPKQANNLSSESAGLGSSKKPSANHVSTKDQKSASNNELHLKYEKNKMLPNKAELKKKRRKVEVDGKKINHLVKKDIYRTHDEDDEEDSRKDDYVLSKLFKKNGVHSALRHDVIVDASNPDYMLVEGEANRVADEAVKALRRSRRQCALATEGIPTWTGSHGVMKPRFGSKKGIPQNKSVVDAKDQPSTSGAKQCTSDARSSFCGVSSKKGVPPSSSDLLASLREKEFQDSGSESDTPTLANTKLETESELLDDIRNFVAFRAATDGQATTDELLREYQSKLPKNLTAVFKALLNKICDFSRTTCGDGLWSLKEEFR